MDRIKYLAAELFNYSYQTYENHLGIGHLRFEGLMPRAAVAVETAEKEHWTDQKLAKEIEMDVETARELRSRYDNAIAVVDSTTPAAGLREALRQAFDTDLGKRMIPDSEIEDFIVQACYRVSDFIFRMQAEAADWQAASDELREEPDSETL